MPCQDWGQGLMCLTLGYSAPPRWPLTPLSSQIRCMLNIWGVILYLRLPWITAQAGIGECCLWGAGGRCARVLVFPGSTGAILNLGYRAHRLQRSGQCGQGALDVESAGLGALPGSVCPQ